MPKYDVGNSMDNLAQQLKDGAAKTQTEIQPVVGSWAMASAKADNGQTGIAISVVPLNCEPFTIIVPDNAMVDFSRHFREAIKFVRSGKEGPVHPPAIVEGAVIENRN